MPRRHTFAAHTLDAIRVLGLEIAHARRARRWTIRELAQRAGVSYETVRSVEAGRPSVAIGTVFELATLLGVELFGAGPARMAELVARGRERLALLPERVREPTTPVDDDF